MCMCLCECESLRVSMRRERRKEKGEKCMILSTIAPTGALSKSLGMESLSRALFSYILLQ